MSWIETIEPENADDILTPLYKRVGNPDGTVDNVMRIHSLNPDSLDAHFEVYVSAMHRRGPIPRYEREIVGTAVSRANGCEYCTHHHAAGLARMLDDDREDLPDSLVDGSVAHLTDREKRMVEYAIKLTQAPQSMHEDDLSPLRDAGLNDREILDLACIVAYFNYANRIVMGLGVELEASGIGQHPVT
ncbi:MAG: peroxidase-related enzyme [Phycisphaerales bacterium JB043]